MSEAVSDAKRSGWQRRRHTLHQRETAHAHHPSGRESKSKQHHHQPQLLQHTEPRTLDITQPWKNAFANNLGIVCRVCQPTVHEIFWLIIAENVVDMQQKSLHYFPHCCWVLRDVVGIEMSGEEKKKSQHKQDRCSGTETPANQLNWQTPWKHFHVIRCAALTNFLLIR